MSSTAIMVIFKLHKAANSVVFPRLVIFCLMLWAFSCNSPESHGSKYYEQVFADANKKYNAQQYQAASFYIDSVYSDRTHIPPYYLYRYYDFKTLYYYVIGKTDSNRIYIDSMLYTLEHYNIAEQYPTEYAQALNSRGDHYYSANDLDNAFEYYYRGKVAARDSKDTCTFANQSYHLGMITYRQEKYTDAISYFKKAYQENNNCKHDSISFFHAQELLNNIALAYTGLAAYDSAISYYRKAIDYNDTGSRRFGTAVTKYAESAIGIICGNLAKVYLATNQTDTARALMLKSIAINSKPGYDNRDAMLVRLQLAGSYTATKELAQSQALLQTVHAWLDTVPDQTMASRWNYQSYLYYNAAANADKALKYLQAYELARDSAETNTRKLKLTDFSQLLENQEGRYQMRLLQKDNQVNRLYLAITIGFVVMAVIIIVLILIHNRKSAKNVKTLTTLNSKVGEQNDQLESAMSQLETTMAQLRLSNGDKDRILSVVAHDLRNPIAGIISLCNFILKDEPSETTRKFLELIVKTSKNSLTLIDELLTFSNEASQTPQSEKELTEINHLLSQATDLLQFKAYEKKQKLNISPCEAELYILADQQKIRRVFSNIIANAIKFSPEFSPISISIARVNNNALITIKDSGVGIPERLQQFVFNAFSPAKRQGTMGEQSFGLGLSICKQIVEAENGRIWFESTEGKGSTFYVELPLTEARA